jgi:hypothetical protein
VKKGEQVEENGKADSEAKVRGALALVLNLLRIGIVYISQLMSKV